MELNAVGIQFDPSPAKKGADEAKKAVGEMADSVARDLKKVEKAGDKTGKEIKQAGEKIEYASKDAKNAVDKLGKSQGFQRLADGARRSGGAISNGVIDMLDTFGLLDGRMGMMVRRVQNGISSFSRFKGVLGSAGGAAAQAGGGMATAGKGAASMATGTAAAATGMGALGTAAAILLPIVVALAAAFAGIAAIGGVFAAIKASIPEASQIEQIETRFAVLLGSYEEAEKRIKSLNKFSDSTPFTDSEVFGAGVQLEAMTKGALATEEALTAIGGAAVVAGKGFTEVAELTGGLYNSLQLGLDYIEPLKTMVKYGLISGDTLKTVKQLGDEARKSGDASANFAEQWALVYGDLQDKSVALVALSQTWGGLLSTLEGKWGALKAEFGEPIMDALKPVITELIGLVERLTPMARKFGEALGDGITFVIQMLRSGQIEQALKLGLAAAFEFAVANWVTYMMLAVAGIVKLVASGMADALTFPIRLFSDLMVGVLGFITKLIEGDFSGAFEMVLGVFKTGGESVIGVMGTMVLNSLGQAFEDAVNVLRDAFYKVWQGIADTISTGLTQIGKDPLAPVALPGRLDVFTPQEVSFGDIRGAANDLVGTGARDKFGSFFDDLVAEGKSQWPDKPDVGGLGGDKPTTENPTPNSTGAGGAAAADKIPKALALQKNELGKLTEAWSDFDAQLDQISGAAVQSIAGGMTDAITGLINGTKDAKTAFSEMALSIISDIVRMVIQMQIQLAVAAALRAMGYGGTAGIAHSGGTVGATNLGTTGSRVQLPTYHSGGMATSEQAIKVEKGESILTRKRAKELEMELAAQRGDKQQQQGGTSEATIINVLDRQEIADAVARRPDAVVNAISRQLPAVRKMVLSGQRM